MSEYFEAIKNAMFWLGKQSDTLFLGQSVVYPGTSIYDSLEAIAATKRIEMPVAEEMQLGISLGLSLEGFTPVSIFPRYNFLICAANQLFNHLDRLSLYSDYKPKVIIRTAVGASKPLDPGPQHQDDFTEAFRLMLRTVDVQRLKEASTIEESYRKAYNLDCSSLLVESGDEARR